MDLDELIAEATFIRAKKREGEDAVMGMKLALVVRFGVRRP